MGLGEAELVAKNGVVALRAAHGFRVALKRRQLRAAGVASRLLVPVVGGQERVLLEDGLPWADVLLCEEAQLVARRNNVEAVGTAFAIEQDREI